MTLRNLLIPSVFLVVASIFATLFFNLGRTGRQINFWVFVTYTVVTMVAFALTALTNLVDTESWMGSYIINQVIFVVLGCVHLYAYNKATPPVEEQPFLHDLIFVVYLCLAGLISYVVVFRFTYPYPAYQLLFATSAIAFISPFFVKQVFEASLKIPALEYKKWYYPVGVELEVPELDDSKLIVVALEYYPNSESRTPTVSRTKAPLLMEFGQLFTLLVDEFNQSDSTMIEYMDENNLNPRSWNFYIKPQKWWQSPKYIDPAATVLENGIAENDVIVAERFNN